nr:ribosomal rna-processing protein 15 [Quercus suber]POE87648.1 ribosomal rna-processing protein 15 [Quercus suber]
MASKRRRNDDDTRRPKKKIRSFKKQKDYYSSSEEDDEEQTTGPKRAFRARDAPAREPAIKEPFVPTGSNATVPVAKPAKSTSKSAVKKPAPKSILKQSKPSKQRKTEWNNEEDDSMDEVVKNTVLNAAPADLDDESDAPSGVMLDAAEVEGLKVDEVDEIQAADDAAALENAIENEEDSVEDDEVDEDEEDISADDDDDESVTSSVTSSNAARMKRKRNDPTAFATSISKILDTKLTTAKRADPVLSRSKSAAEANASLSNSKLEAKARAQIRSERRTAMERGRIKDVLGVESEGVDTGKILEAEKKLKKMAQRGVVRLFNAVRAAQVKAEEAMQQAKNEGVVGMKKREEQVNEMSKQGFLDLISSGGKKNGIAA